MKLFNRRVRKIAQLVSALMLALMFIVFILQVVVRYSPMEGFEWTLEFCLLLWLWLVFWGAGLMFDCNDHVRFDLAYRRANPRTKRWWSLITAVAVLIGLGISLGPTWSYVSFLLIKPSPSLPLSMGQIYSVYLLFMLVMMVRYLAHIVALVKEARQPAQMEEGVSR